MKKTPAPVAHHTAIGNAAFAGMRHLATNGGQQAVAPLDNFQAQEDFVSSVPYRAKPTPGVKKGR